MDWLINTIQNQWVWFNILVIALLIIDLGLIHRGNHKISAKEGLIWSVIWIVVALIFNVFYYYWQGPQKGLEFFNGYLIERSLSIDNIFVFLLIFTFFKVSDKYQYKVLFWGIIGALVFRGLFIGVGALLIQQFHWILYVFGAFLVYTGIKMAFAGDSKIEPEKNPVLRFTRRFFPVSPNYDKGHFVTKIDGRKYFTPLFVVLIAVETTDVVFAFDSIPAIFGITEDPFIIYSSNVFAILGLRALYFAIAGLMDMFSYLKYGLGAILAFVGVKMLISPHFIHIDNMISLIIIALLLAASIVASIMKREKPQKNSSA